MKRTRLQIILVILVVLFLISCQKETNLDSNNGEELELIQGEIDEEDLEDDLEEDQEEIIEDEVSPYQANKLVGSPGIDFYNGVADPRTIVPYIVTEIDRTTLVNKYNALPEDYAPEDLEEIYTNLDQGFLRAEAAKAWNELFEKARSEGVELVVLSSYRSKYDQEDLFNNYFYEDPEWAFLYSAHPRRSEHEMGYAVDVGYNNYLPDDFYSSPQGIFMRDNASDFGFILRYQEGKEHITGYGYESWHFRYLGKELAKELEARDITLEEYYGLLASDYMDLEGKDVKGQIIVDGEYVNVREGPSTDYRIIGGANQGEVFDFYDSLDGWYLVSLNGKSSWIISDYVMKMEPYFTR